MPDSKDDNEPNYFDKFMTDICEREERKKMKELLTEDKTPGRRYMERYREHLHNRIVYKRG